jgi:uncharacterized DUF497 family protein
MRFEWDESKNKINIKKHGIDFQDVIEVFNGPMIVNIDDRYDYQETRLIGFGWMRQIAVLIVHVEIDDDTIRILSARKANRYERKRFEEEIKNRLG